MLTYYFDGILIEIANYWKNTFLTVVVAAYLKTGV